MIRIERVKSRKRKYFVSIVLITLLMTGLVYAGVYEDQHHLVQVSGGLLGGLASDVALNDAACVDKSHNWIVGERTILFSKNGRKWIKQYENAGQTFEGIAMSNSQNGVAVGRTALVKRTTDGNTWTAAAVINDNWVLVNEINFFDVTVSSPNYWACGAFGTIIESTNNGAMWTKVPLSIPNEGGALNGIDYVSSYRVIAVGDNGVIYKRAVGGASFIKLPTANAGNNANTLKDVDFYTNGSAQKVGIAVGINKTLLKSTDLGETWTVKAPADISGSPINLLGVKGIEGTNTVIVVGTAGRVLVNTNNGDGPWTDFTAYASNVDLGWALQNRNLHGIDMADINNGVIVGWYLTPDTPVLAQFILDVDKDTLPGDWEATYSLNDNSAVGINGAAGDKDGDGYTNLQEYENGTNPNNNLDYPGGPNAFIEDFEDGDITNNPSWSVYADQPGSFSCAVEGGSLMHGVKDGWVQGNDNDHDYYMGGMVTYVGGTVDMTNKHYFDISFKNKSGTGVAPKIEIYLVDDSGTNFTYEEGTDAKYSATFNLTLSAYGTADISVPLPGETNTPFVKVSGSGSWNPTHNLTTGGILLVGVNFSAGSNAGNTLSAGIDDIFFSVTKNTQTATLTSSVPTADNPAGGRAITLTGTNFLPGAKVSFGGTLANAYATTVNSKTQIVSVVPAHAAGVIQLKVINTDGVETGTIPFTYDASIPTGSVSDNYQAAPGTVLTFIGDNTYIISVPYDLNSAGLVHAADLMNKLNRIGEGGVTGDYVTQVMKFKPNHAVTENAFDGLYYNVLIGLGGTDFSLQAGESYVVVVAQTVTHNIDGNFPLSFNLNINNSVENEQFISLPYNLVGAGKKFATMEDLFKEVNDIADVAAINPLDIEVTRVYTYNPTTMDWDVAYWNPLLGFQNGSVPLVSGYGYVFTVNTLSAPPYLWNPQN